MNNLKCLIETALTLCLVLMPSFSEASEKELYSIEQAKQMGYVAPSDSVYDKMYSVAIHCIGVDYEKAEFEHLANKHKDWEEDILDDCASYRTVMEVCRFYFEQPVFWDTVGDIEWGAELQTLVEYWLEYDPKDRVIQEYAKYD